MTTFEKTSFFEDTEKARVAIVINTLVFFNIFAFTPALLANYRICVHSDFMAKLHQTFEDMILQDSINVKEILTIFKSSIGFWFECLILIQSLTQMDLNNFFADPEYIAKKYFGEFRVDILKQYAEKFSYMPLSGRGALVVRLTEKKGYFDTIRKLKANKGYVFNSPQTFYSGVGDESAMLYT